MTRPGDVCERVVSAEASEAWGLPAGVEVVGGTTDSIAAFVACATDIDKGALNVAAGDAVTSLGSTTALKLVSKTRVDDSSVGVYSHRLEDNWLVGGASNAGCRVLREFAFTNDELEQLSMGLDAAATNDKGIYPLVAPGERFPYNDASKEPILPQRDGDRAAVLADLLVGIADVERLGYLALKERARRPSSPCVRRAAAPGTRSGPRCARIYSASTWSAPRTRTRRSGQPRCWLRVGKRAGRRSVHYGEDKIEGRGRHRCSSPSPRPTTRRGRRCPPRRASCAARRRRRRSS